jgi:4-aminobutyrate aminotransferase
MDIKARYQNAIAGVMPVETPLEFVRGEGSYLIDAQDRRYLDLMTGIAVNVLGYGHPAILKAIEDQAKKYTHLYNGLGYSAVVASFAEAVQEITEPGYRVYFGNSGTEAVEAALKLARMATGRPGIIAFRGAFHGRTFGSLSLTASNSLYRSGYEPLVPAVYHVDYPAPTRLGLDPSAALAHTQKQLQSLVSLEIDPAHVAVIVVEPVQGEGGYVIPPDGFMPWLADFCHQHGILLAVDEVQAGMGRTGKWFSYQHANIHPDLIITGKALGGGLPISALSARPDLMDKWPVGTHGSTFGGNPVACATGLATLRVMKEEGLVERATRLGALAMERLAPARRLPNVVDVRGLGLMVAVEFQADVGGAIVEDLVEEGLRQGMIVHPAGLKHEVIRLMPPLNIDEAIFAEALDTLVTMIEKVSQRHGAPR